MSGYQQRELMVSTGPEGWNVKELPEEGRPSPFSGAIGDFEVSATASPEKVEVGEPITLKMMVEGTGNFDRLDAPQLVQADGWRIYPPTHKVEWKPGTNEGRKMFEQALIPRSDGLEGIPDLTFNFFNPATGKYITRTVAAPKVTILDAPKSSKKTVAAAEHEDAADEAESSMVPIEVRLTPFVTGFTPVYREPWFAAVNTLPLAILLLGYLAARRRQRFENDPEFARAVRASREVTVELERMRTAARAQDPVAFFSAARRAVQQKAAEKWSLRSEDVTAEIVAARQPELAESVAQLYAAADEVMYSGFSTTGVPLEEWLKSVSQQLRMIGKGSA
jgi:hypothetical protein